MRIVADGAKIEPVASTSKPEVTNSLAFAPRAGRKVAKNKLGLGAGHSVAKTDKVLDSVAPSDSSNPQDFFRSLVTAKNKQREGKLDAAKAPAAKAPHFVHASAAAEAEGQHALPDTSIETESSGDRGEKRGVDVDGEEKKGKKVKFA